MSGMEAKCRFMHPAMSSWTFLECSRTSATSPLILFNRDSATSVAFLGLGKTWLSRLERGENCSGGPLAR